MSFPRHGQYKPSGLKLLGDVPMHWERTALKYMGEYQNGYPFKPEDRAGQGLPIIRISQLSGDTEPNLYDGTLDDRVFVQDGDLLFSWSATIDSFIWTGGPAWLNQHIFKVTPSGEAHKGFLFYVIKHIAPKLAEFDAHGSTMRHIKKESLGERIYVPAIAEQAEIATFLDQETAKIDALVDEQRRLIDLLKEKRQAVISRAVTKGLNANATMRDSGAGWIGHVPQHWRVSALGYAARIDSGSTPDRANPNFWGGSIPWVKTGEVNYDPITQAEECITEAGLQGSSAKVALPGTLLMAMYGQGVTRGRVALLEVPAAYNQACAAIHFDLAVVPSFGRYFFMAAYEHVRDGGNETSQMNLSTGAIQKFKIAVPPEPEQLAIVEFLDRSIREIELLIEHADQSLTLLSERRSALISAAVTGKIDVRGLVPQPEAVAA